MATAAVSNSELATIKARQQRAWASGDYAAVAARTQPMGERLCEAADLRAGWRVLDVAAGSGNAALAAARCGCEATALDYIPELLERGRVRAQAEGFDVNFVEGDAEALPFEDGWFDAVISCVGVMFTPDQERAAAEILRVCRPGGTIALANWTPDGFVGEVLAAVGRHVPSLAGVRPPALWGTEERLGELLGRGVSTLEGQRRTFVFRFRAAEELVEFFGTGYGPAVKAFEELDAAGREWLADDLTELVRRHDRSDGGAVAIPSHYLEAVAVRRAAATTIN